MALFDFLSPVGDPRLRRQLQQEATGVSMSPAEAALRRAGQLQARQRVSQAQTLGGPSGQAAALRNSQLANTEADSAIASQASVLRQRQQEVARAELQRQREAEQARGDLLTRRLAGAIGDTLSVGPIFGEGQAPGQDQYAQGQDPADTFGGRAGQPATPREQQLLQAAASGQIRRPTFPAGPTPAVRSSISNDPVASALQRSQDAQARQQQPQQLGYAAPAQPAPGQGPGAALAQPLAPFFAAGSQQGAPPAPFGLDPSALAGLAPYAMLLSDERQKEQARQEGAQQAIEMFMRSMQPQQFSYRADPAQQQRAGVMAQDVAQTPVGRQMVQQTPQGLALDPVQALGPTLAALSNLDQRLRATEERLTGQRSTPTPGVGAPLDLGPARGRPAGPTRRRRPQPAAAQQPADAFTQPPLTSAEVRRELPNAPTYAPGTAPESYSDFTYSEPFAPASPYSTRRGR